MKTKTILLAVIAVLMCGCSNGKEETSIKKDDVLVQDTFYGAKFGEPIGQAKKKIEENTGKPCKTVRCVWFSFPLRYISETE